MPIYLSPMVKTFGRGRNPAGWEGQSPERCNWIYLPNRDQSLVWSEDRWHHSLAQEIANDPWEHLTSRTARRALAELAPDRSIHAGQCWNRVLVDILRRPPTRAAGRLLPTKQGRYEVWFGPGGPGKNRLYEAWTVPQHSSKDIQDSFDRTDGDLNGSTSSDAQFTWSETQGTAWTITTNAAQVTGVGLFCVAVVSLNMDTTDHYAEGVIGTWSYVSANLTLGLAARVRYGDGRTTGGDEDEGCGIEISQTAASTYARRMYNWRTDANLAADTTQTTSGTIRLECNGSTVRFLVNAVQSMAPVTAPVNAIYKKTGITYYAESSSNLGSFASFRAADLVAAGRTTHNIRSHPLGINQGMALRLGGGT